MSVSSHRSLQTLDTRHTRQSLQSWRRVGLQVALVAVVAASAAACLVDPAPTQRGSDGTAPTSTAPAPSSTAPPPSSPPPKVSIDTGRTLTVQPGEGAGLFVTYAGAGRWLVSWTCDTYASARSCDFDISVAATQVSSLNPTPSNAIVANDSSSFRAQTRTSATIDSVGFNTDPGGSIVVSSTLNGVSSPDLLFYVSSGKLATAPTEPIELVPTPE